MVPLWFTLSALCFVGAAVLLYVDIDRRRGLGRRRKSWARSHGFDYEPESTEIVKRWKRGVMSTVGDVTARNVVLGQIRGEAVFIFDLDDVATVIALHHKVGTSVVVDLRLKGVKEPRENDTWLLGAIGPRMVYSTNLDAARRACDRRMVTFAHTAPDCAEIMWNEENWTLVSMPISSTRAQWDEGLRTVRQFNDLLRVLPPLPQQAAIAAPRRKSAPGRPAAPAELPTGRSEAPASASGPSRAGQSRTGAPHAAAAQWPAVPALPALVTDVAAPELTAIDRAELARLVRELSVVRGRVVLSSGKESDYYVDLRRATLNHRAARLIGTLMRELTADWDYVAVGGLTLGADPVATSIMHAAGRPIDAFVVRKSAKTHGMQRLIEGFNVTDRRVLVVEDTSTTGASPLTAVRAVRAAGGVVVGVATVVDRATGAAEVIEAEGLPYRSVLELGDLGLAGD